MRLTRAITLSYRPTTRRRARPRNRIHRDATSGMVQGLPAQVTVRFALAVALFVLTAQAQRPRLNLRLRLRLQYNRRIISRGISMRKVCAAWYEDLSRWTLIIASLQLYTRKIGRGRRSSSGRVAGRNPSTVDNADKVHAAHGGGGGQPRITSTSRAFRCRC